MITERYSGTPQSIDASIMPLQLIHNVQIVDPVLVAIDASDIRIRPALVADLPLQQAVIHTVLHPEG